MCMSFIELDEGTGNEQSIVNGARQKKKKK
jgi:hypothetical protein